MNYAAVKFFPGSTQTQCYLVIMKWGLFLYFCNIWRGTSRSWWFYGIWSPKGMVPLMQPASFSSSPNQDNCPDASNVAIARWQLNLVNTIWAGLGMAIHIMKATQILDPLIHQTLHMLYLRVRNNGRIIWGVNCVSVCFIFCSNMYIYVHIHSLQGINRTASGEINRPECTVCYFEWI